MGEEEEMRLLGVEAEDGSVIYINAHLIAFVRPIVEVEKTYHSQARTMIELQDGMRLWTKETITEVNLGLMSCE